MSVIFPSTSRVATTAGDARTVWIAAQIS